MFFDIVVYKIMKSWFVRCAHCGVEYLYHTHENVSRFSKEYCRDCCTLLENALESVPVRFKAGWEEIEYDNNHRTKISEALKRIGESEDENAVLVCSPIQWLPSDMESGYIIETSFVRYAVCKDDEGKEHLFHWGEYDLLEEKFSGKEWNVGGGERKYQMYKSFHFKSYDVCENSLPKPYGVLLYNEILYEN